jgi:hypothetical protein
MGKQLTTEIIIARCKEVHGDKYVYSLVKYVNSKTKIKIICPLHGEFEQNIWMHLNSQGCRKCSNEKNGKQKALDLSQVLEEFRKTHGNKYDYSLITEYKNRQGKLKIICPEHGIFEQSSNHHKNGADCQKCARENVKNIIKEKYDTYGSKCTLGNEKFIERANLIHNSKYDYSKVDYKKSDQQVIIICPIHGEFIQLPKNHIRGAGCKKCNNRQSKKEINWLNSLGIDYIPLYVLPERPCRIVDGYDPKTHTILQYHGNYWHGNPKFFNKNDIHKQLNKTFGELYERTLRLDQELRDLGYNLIVKWED